MDSKHTSVKNPLTVIAIFAGIAEISGTAVLPHIEAGNQSLYIWFLMLFPFALIGLFFLTLNFNHRVLYAPSDFKDEDNFVNILKKTTYSELQEYKQQEVIATELEEISSLSTVQDQVTSESAEFTTSKAIDNSPQKIDQWISNADSVLLDLDTITTPSQRDQMDLIFRQISKRRMSDSRLAQKFALEKLEMELGVSIDREMKIESGFNTVYFDGIARRGGSLAAVMVRYFRTSKHVTMSLGSWQTLRQNLESIFQTLSDEQRRNFSFVFVIVYDNDAEVLQRIVLNKLAELPFPIAVKLYDFDSLTAARNG